MADISSNDEPLFELALFAGAGGGILGGKLLGWRTVCAVEINAYAASVLVARQNDGCLEPFPVWDDIRTFRSDNSDCSGMFAMLRGIKRRLVISGGFPCQDISVAGAGAGLDGERSGLWSEQARIIREIRPAYAFVENSPALTGRGLHRVLADLAAMGFDAEWGVISASQLDGNCKSERIWIAATSTESRRTKMVCRHKALSKKTYRRWSPVDADSRSRIDRIRALEQVVGEPAILGGGDAIPDRVDRLAAIGNGQIPRVAATAWRILSGR